MHLMTCRKNLVVWGGFMIMFPIRSCFPVCMSPCRLWPQEVKSIFLSFGQWLALTNRTSSKMMHDAEGRKCLWTGACSFVSGSFCHQVRKPRLTCYRVKTMWKEWGSQLSWDPRLEEPIELQCELLGMFLYLSNLNSLLFNGYLGKL